MNNDPYFEERKKEYAAYHRMAIRTVPFCMVLYIVAVSQSAEEFVWKDYLWVLSFHIGIEAIYAAINRDSLLVSLGVLGAWIWCGYSWLFGGLGIFEAFILPLVLLYAVAKVPIYINWYRDIKKKNLTSASK